MVVGSIGIQPQYFLDEMSSAELDAVLQAYDLQYKNTWEQTRYIAYAVVAVQNDSIKTPQDLLKFTWEQDQQQPEEITLEERQRREAEMLQWLNKI